MIHILPFLGFSLSKNDFVGRNFLWKFKIWFISILMIINLFVFNYCFVRIFVFWIPTPEYIKRNLNWWMFGIINTRKIFLLLLTLSLTIKRETTNRRSRQILMHQPVCKEIFVKEVCGLISVAHICDFKGPSEPSYLHDLVGFLNNEYLSQ